MQEVVAFFHSHRLTPMWPHLDSVDRCEITLLAGVGHTLRFRFDDSYPVLGKRAMCLKHACSVSYIRLQCRPDILPVTIIRLVLAKDLLST